MKYYRDTQPLKMAGHPIEVVENNDHLGQIISGSNQVTKNIDVLDLDLDFLQLP